MHTIHVDRSRLLVHMRLSGFFAPPAAEQALGELRAAVRSLGADAGRHLTLYDMVDMDVSPVETIAAMQARWSEPAARPIWARRVAYCAPSALLRMQAKRLRTVRPDIAVFDNRAQALQWLFAPDDGAARAG